MFSSITTAFPMLEYKIDPAHICKFYAPSILSFIPLKILQADTKYS